MNTTLPEFPDTFNMDTALRFDHNQYWCVVNKDNGKWFGYVGSSGTGNQQTKYAAFVINRPCTKCVLTSILFEFLTNQVMFSQMSRRKYRFVLTALVNLLSSGSGRSWGFEYRGRPAYLAIGNNRQLTMCIKGVKPVSFKLEDWTPVLLCQKVFKQKQLATA